MKSKISVDGISIEVTRKRIKNMYLRVYPAKEVAAISCPWHVAPSTVVEFAQKKIPWIKTQLEKKTKHRPIPAFQYVSNEYHPVQGKWHKLKVITRDGRQSVELNGENELVMHVNKGTLRPERISLIDEWLRKRLKREIPAFISHWEPLMKVKVDDWRVKKMKTRWGTCNIPKRRVWINLELAKYPPACLEFIIVHEMVHLHERLHSKRFFKLMDAFLPDWREREKLLNRFMQKVG